MDPIFLYFADGFIGGIIGGIIGYYIARIAWE